MERGEFEVDEFTVAVRLDGTRFSYSRNILRTDGATTLSGARGSKSVFDGQISMDYSGVTNPHNLGSGAITAEPYAFNAKEVTIWPLLVTYRGLVPALSDVTLKECSIAGQGRTHDGKRPMILREDRGRFRYEYWLDGESDLAPVRILTQVRGHDSYRIDIRYTNEDTSPPRLAGWDITKLSTDDGQLRHVLACNVTKLAWNVDMPIDAFTIDYPAGTLIENRITGQTYRASSSADRMFAWVAGALVVAIVAYAIAVFRRRRRSLS